MRRWLLILILAIVMLPLVQGICCEKRKDCIISETCQDAACGNCSITIYNRTGAVNIAQSNMKVENPYLYTFNTSRNLSRFDVYPYAINCTNNKICNGDCQVEIKQECGEREGMTTGIVWFLLLLNVGVFLTPTFVKRFTQNEVSNFIIRRFLFMGGIIILWFNTSIFRTMAIDFGLDIDNFLLAYWWFFTLAMFVVIFLSVYFMVIGAIRLSKQAQVELRMGGKGGEERF